MSVCQTQLWLWHLLSMGWLVKGQRNGIAKIQLVVKRKRKLARRKMAVRQVHQPNRRKFRAIFSMKVPWKTHTSYVTMFRFLAILKLNLNYLHWFYSYKFRSGCFEQTWISMAWSKEEKRKAQINFCVENLKETSERDRKSCSFWFKLCLFVVHTVFCCSFFYGCCILCGVIFLLDNSMIAYETNAAVATTTTHCLFLATNSWLKIFHLHILFCVERIFHIRYDTICLVVAI